MPISLSLREYLTLAIRSPLHTPFAIIDKTRADEILNDPEYKNLANVEEIENNLYRLWNKGDWESKVYHDRKKSIEIEESRRISLERRERINRLIHKMAEKLKVDISVVSTLAELAIDNNMTDVIKQYEQ